MIQKEVSINVITGILLYLLFPFPAEEDNNKMVSD